MLWWKTESEHQTSVWYKTDKSSQVVQFAFIYDWINSEENILGGSTLFKERFANFVVAGIISFDI